MVDGRTAILNIETRNVSRPIRNFVVVPEGTRFSSTEAVLKRAQVFRIRSFSRRLEYSRDYFAKFDIVLDALDNRPARDRAIDCALRRMIFWSKVELNITSAR